MGTNFESPGKSLLQLQWNSYSTSWHAALSTLRTTGQYCDLTLVVDDGHLPAHRAVVTSCSPLLARALAVCHHPHPAVVLRGVNMDQMKGLLDFMYMGETTVEQTDIESFLKAAEELGVTGLVDTKEECSEQEEDTKNESETIKDSYHEKKSKKRAKTPSTSESPESKRCKKNKIKANMKKERKTNNDFATQHQECELKSSSTNEDCLELSSPLKSKPTVNSNGGDNDECDEFAEPEIVFKKVFTPYEKDDKSKKETEDVIEELTVTVTPSKKNKHMKDVTSRDKSTPVSGGDVKTPTKQPASPAGTGPRQLSSSSPDKYVSSGGDKSMMTNLPQDRAKLRDIWDTLVASEDVQGEVVYSCLCCEKTFRGKSAKSNAWSHVDHNHTPHIEHKCHICDFTSKSNDGLSRHISKIHKKEQVRKEEQKVEDEEMIVLD